MDKLTIEMTTGKFVAIMSLLLFLAIWLILSLWFIMLNRVGGC